MPPSTHLRPFLCLCLPLAGVPSVFLVVGSKEKRFSPELPHLMWVEKIPPATSYSSHPGNSSFSTSKRIKQVGPREVPITFGGGGRVDFSAYAFLLRDSTIIWAKLREFMISGYFFCSSSNAITAKGRIRVTSRIQKEQSVGASTHPDDTSD